MGTLSAKKITEALAKARDVGIIEEDFTIGDCTVTLRNLRPDHYKAIYAECKGLDEIDYLYGFQIAHICRSIVAINGMDLRDADFIEVEDEVVDSKTGEPVLDPSTNLPKVRRIKLERYVYLRDRLLETWGKEVVYTTYRKFNDVAKKAEDKSKDGVTFLLPEETPEDQLRRVLDELREVMGEVPDTLLDKVLEDVGLMRISTANELKKAMEKADQLAREQAAAAEAETEANKGGDPPNDASPPDAAPAPLPPPTAPQAATPRVRSLSPAELMERRQPMNQQPVIPPTPLPAGHAVQPAPIQSAPRLDARALAAHQRIAAIEGGALDLPPGGSSGPQVPGPAPAEQTAVLAAKGQDQVDIRKFNEIVEQPPSRGINPRYRPPPR